MGSSLSLSWVLSIMLDFLLLPLLFVLLSRFLRLIDCNRLSNVLLGSSDNDKASTNKLLVAIEDLSFSIGLFNKVLLLFTKVLFLASAIGVSSLSVVRKERLLFEDNRL